MGRGEDCDRNPKLPAGFASGPNPGAGCQACFLDHLRQRLSQRVTPGDRIGRTMDDESRQLLKQICAVLQDVVEHTFRIHEMAERNHAATSQLVSDYRRVYEEPSLIDVHHMQQAKRDISDRLQKVIERLH